MISTQAITPESLPTQTR